MGTILIVILLIVLLTDIRPIGRCQNRNRAA